MADTVRPRRSALYMPGSNARALEKGRSLPADILILDLEDAVAPDAKENAREQIAAAIREGGYGAREIVVRINALDTPWGRADLEAVASLGADAILLPKVEDARMVQNAELLMNTHGAPRKTAIWCMIETPRGVLHADRIAGSDRRLGCLVMGTSDLAKDLHAAHTPDRLPMVAALGHCVLAARAHGLAILDGVHLDLDDDEGFAQSCRQGREFGFDGKTLIHPKTIAAANEIFAPGEAELAQARKIIAAHAEAQAAGKGVVVVDGRLIENLHVEDAQRLVAMGKAIARRESEGA
ncbi:MAG: CoA ester lyase [Rhodospirillaceae bacterium]|jgi:citrate lyase subunit beta / citryl-CoA lyase|nr:CoA ester lyase [Rhodospirillaceae bacterium]MBT6118490.1 CoA ester lyase [Rhodospirillaceae bacterium]